MWGALIKRIFKRILTRLAKKSMGASIKAFLARFAVKITKPVLSKFPTIALAEDSKIAKLANKVKGIVAKLFSNTGNFVTTPSEDKKSEKELDSEKEDDSDDIGFALIAGTTMLTATVASAKAVASRVEINLPDLEFPNIESGGIGLPTIKFNAKNKANTGKELKVQNSKAFKYKNVEMTSARYGNPLNIRTHKDKNDNINENYWEGQSGHYWSSAGDFTAFTDPFYSFRAAARTIMTYQSRGKHNIHDWLYTYCPVFDKYAGKQQTQAYVDDVVNRVNQTRLIGNITEYTPLDITDKNTYIAVLKGMAWHESNLDVSEDYLARCYDAQFLGMPIPLQQNDGGYFMGSTGGTFVKELSIVTASGVTQRTTCNRKQYNI